MRLGSRRTILETVDCTTARLYQVGPLLWALYKLPANGLPRHQQCSGRRNTDQDPALASMCLSSLLLQT